MFVFRCENCKVSIPLNEGCEMFQYCPRCGVEHDARDFIEKVIAEKNDRDRIRFLTRGAICSLLVALLWFLPIFLGANHFVLKHHLWVFTILAGSLLGCVIIGLGVTITQTKANKKFPSRPE